MNILFLPKPFTTTAAKFPTTAHPRPLQSLTLRPIKSNSENNNTTTNNDVSDTSPQSPPQITPPNTVEIRFRRGSRRKKQQQEDGAGNGRLRSEMVSAPKNWNDMNLTEKAIELYMGEKGMLFWLNKLAYASIFVVIGGWILFRFVGPSLNLYQLDSPPLSPTSILKGS